ncbi:metastasis-suppressor KiSS-1 [Callorhinchus milii]|uniref:metastasis-suppressor KiSS-1 n=1 Tax=Callorhinchus milii TaxID=7868 RepID=UPI001C3F56C8|nr:metastasis-suppressor KiSS-1 [Callorhinchus milii]XP_007909025.2 metastasis-suppressor KiSS-1 [Callorhinchus milii]
MKKLLCSVAVLAICCATSYTMPVSQDVSGSLDKTAAEVKSAGHRGDGSLLSCSTAKGALLWLSRPDPKTSAPPKPSGPQRDCIRKILTSFHTQSRPKKNTWASYNLNSFGLKFGKRLPRPRGTVGG